MLAIMSSWMRIWKQPQRIVVISLAINHEPLLPSNYYRWNIVNKGRNDCCLHSLPSVVLGDVTVEARFQARRKACANLRNQL